MNVLGPNDCIFSSLDNIYFLSAPCLTIFVKDFFLFEVQVRLWRNEHCVTKWLIRLSQSLHPNVHKGILKHHAKFDLNQVLTFLGKLVYFCCFCCQHPAQTLVQSSKQKLELDTKFTISYSPNFLLSSNTNSKHRWNTKFKLQTEAGV